MTGTKRQQLSNLRFALLVALGGVTAAALLFLLYSSVFTTEQTRCVTIQHTEAVSETRCERR